MPEKASGSASAYNAAVVTAQSEGRRLTAEERLANPAVQKELAAVKAARIKSAERAVERAEADVKAAKEALALAKKENG